MQIQCRYDIDTIPIQYRYNTIPKIPKNTQKYPTIPKNTKKYKKIPKNTQKYLKISESTLKYPKHPEKLKYPKVP